MGGDIKLRRHAGRYVAEYYEQGRRHRRSLGTSDRQEAEVAFIEFRRSYSFAETGTPLTMGEIYDSYVGDRVRAGRVAVPRMRDAWKRLGSTFANVKPSDITKALCQGFMSQRHREGASSGTVHVELGYLRSALRYAEHEGWIAKAPYIPMPSKPAPRDHRLTRDEIERLLEHAWMPHVKLFIVLAMTTAGRAGAILDLTWDRVDLERRRIALHDPQRRTTAKGRATVPMNDTAFLWLSRAYQARVSDYVVEWGGEKVGSVKKGIMLAARRAGLVCTPHVLRHSSACLLAEAGVPMAEIAAYLGHSNPATTFKVYAKFSPDYLQKAARALELK